MKKQPTNRQKNAGFLSGCGLWSNKCAMIAVIAALLAIAVILISQPPAASQSLADNQTTDFYENAFFSYDINRYPANAQVSNVSGEKLAIGFSIDPWNLNFGIVPNGGSFGKRFITLRNSEDKDVIVHMRSSGDIVPFVEFSRNDFVLKKGESAPVDIIFRTENDTIVGDYAGEIDVVVKQPKYDILSGVGWLG